MLGVFRSKHDSGDQFGVTGVSPVVHIGLDYGASWGHLAALQEPGRVPQDWRVTNASSQIAIPR